MSVLLVAGCGSAGSSPGNATFYDGPPPDLISPPPGPPPALGATPASGDPRPVSPIFPIYLPPSPAPSPGATPAPVPMATTLPVFTPSPTVTLAPVPTPAAGATVGSTTDPTPPPGASYLPDQEAYLLQQTNAARQAKGIAPLVSEPELVIIARYRSDDMGTRSYFSHTTPEGTNVFDIMTQDGLAFMTAGENIAMDSYPLAESASQTFAGWMGDAGHRDNILNPAFGHIGIGGYATVAGEHYYTQDFTN